MRKKQAILPKNILAQNIPEGAVVPWLVWLSCPVAGPIAGCDACQELQPSWPATATCSAQPASGEWFPRLYVVVRRKSRVAVHDTRTMGHPHFSAHSEAVLSQPCPRADLLRTAAFQVRGTVGHGDRDRPTPELKESAAWLSVDTACQPPIQESDRSLVCRGPASAGRGQF